MIKRFASKTYFYLVLTFLYAPIITLVAFSFNESKSRGIWGGFSLVWYKSLFGNTQIISSLINTIIIALIAALIATIIGTVASIGLFRSGSIFRKSMMNLTYLPMMNSDIVTGVSLMLLFTMLRFELGFGTLLLSHITFCIPYVILAVLPKLYQINPSIYEAALDLGSSTFHAYRKIIIPDIMPGILSGFLISITLSIDDFMISFFTTGKGVQNISILVYTMTKRGIKPEINALSTIMFGAILVLLLIINLKDNKSKAKREMY